MIAHAIAKLLFDMHHVAQLHIIGCSRSGTTLLQLAMCCFKNTELAPDESSARYPFLSDRIGILRTFRERGIPRHERKFFVTKRARHWLRPRAIEYLKRRVVSENVGLIHIVRDPRDVLLSRHATYMPHMNYVDAEHWRQSIAAADELEQRFAPGGRFMTLRYEDLVMLPVDTEARIEAMFGLERRADAAPINRLEANLKQVEDRIYRHLLDNLGTVRDMEPSSIGKWRTRNIDAAAPFDASPEMREAFDGFCARHGYLN